MDFGKAIRIVRAARGISQKELASRLRLDRSYVSLLEANQRKPSDATLETISRTLDVPIYLLTLLASGRDDFQKIPSRHAENLGRILLDTLIQVRA
jgi:transcriptional regulator with XRE-family HTH domain